MSPRILAIDPGTTHTAYVLFDGDIIFRKGILPNEEMRELLGGGSLYYHKAAIEMIASYGMAVGREVLETCVWIGRFIENIKTPYRLVYRKDVKLHLCNSLRAKDGNIRQALIDKYGLPGTKKNQGKLYGVSTHLWAALAVADYVLTSPV
jgi:hypothetical protein